MADTRQTIDRLELDGFLTTWSRWPHGPFAVLEDLHPADQPRTSFDSQISAIFTSGVLNGRSTISQGRQLAGGKQAPLTRHLRTIMNVLLILPPAENFDHVYERRLRESFPGLKVDCIEHHDLVGPYIGDADILMTFSPFMADHVVRDAKRLQWIQVLGSGVDGIVNLPSLRKDILITNGRGVQATPVSEAAFALMLALSRQMPRMAANQSARRWERWPSQVLHGRTLGILGVGQIGEELALKAKAFGMRVVGISSSDRAVNGFDQMAPRDRLAEAVRDLDYLVLLTPCSPETHHIVNADVLRQMKRSAFLINVARGGVLNEADLVEALRRQTIRGAALDVFSEEPLPADHELWSLPNVIISPHLGGLNSSYPESILPLVVKNIALFLADRRQEMLNIVSPGAA